MRKLKNDDEEATDDDEEATIPMACTKAAMKLKGHEWSTNTVDICVIVFIVVDFVIQLK